MVSLRFPFSFSQPPVPKKPSSISRPSSSSSLSLFTTVACATAAAILQSPHRHSLLQDALSFLIPAQSFHPWGSLSLADSSPPVVESNTGFPFHSVLDGSRKLLGVGLRRKTLFGLKNIDVYAFGVYADENDVKKELKKKYGKFSTNELKESKEIQQDLMEKDIRVTVRLQIVYGRLSIRSVRSAFEESVGGRLQKFGQGNNKELLQRFTSQFKDEYKIPRGSVIDLSRDRGHVLRTIIDGKEVGCIQSKLLCQSILDLYIGEEPFDQKATKDVKLNLASLIQ
ncbi:hypothetical protein SAY86_021524 [Trapa natans]|uniref:Chalcone isomerase domain-containing protein n=1 Tax=Trapa natans TaxID=22666 RepID=A0AAN7MKK4_TRANT|nr:hypothetical protein SAY86_021524 [Trapa natans]